MKSSEKTKLTTRLPDHPKKHREKANSDVVEQFSHSDTDSFKFTFFKDNDKWQIQQIYPILGLVLSEIFYKT